MHQVQRILLFSCSIFVRTKCVAMRLRITLFNFVASVYPLVVVNMILINMMMAIINLSFERIKENAARFKNKFELLEYIKRSIREVVGITVARRDRPVYTDQPDDGENMDTSDEEELEVTEKMSQEFTNKTDALLK